MSSQSCCSRGVAVLLGALEDVYILKNLLDNGWISPEDMSLIHMAKTPEDACRAILDFYRVYHFRVDTSVTTWCFDSSVNCRQSVSSKPE